MLVIGKNPILEALRTNPKDINKILLLKNMKPEPRLKEIISLSQDNGIKFQFLHKPDFIKYFQNKDKTEGISQGVVGFMKDYEYKSLRDMVKDLEPVKTPLILLLDEITDPHNLGSIARSAVCLGADGIIIPRHNSAEVNHTVIKTSSGAVNYIPIAMETNLSNSIRYLKDNGYFITGADSKAEKNSFEMNFDMKTGLVIGSEGSGMRKSIRDNCDRLVRIPMAGRFDSLNASVSAAVLIYEIFRQKNKK